MVEYLDRLGFMKPKTAFIHGARLKPKEIEILAHTGVTIQHNPTSNLKVGSGLAPIRALIAGGVNVSMGTDGCGSIEGARTCRTRLYLASLLAKLVRRLHRQGRRWTDALFHFADDGRREGARARA